MSGEQQHQPNDSFIMSRHSKLKRSPVIVDLVASKLVAFVLILHIVGRVQGLLPDGEPSYVFPMHQDTNRRPWANYNNNNALYINPNPSTRSQPIGQDKRTEQLKRRSPNPTLDRIVSSPSSIGKNEQSQVAEWPFFKSIQTVRQNQLVTSAKQRVLLPDELDLASKKFTVSSNSKPEDNRGIDLPVENYKQKLNRQQPLATTTSFTTTTTTRPQTDDANGEIKLPVNSEADNESGEGLPGEETSTTTATTTVTQATEATTTTTLRPMMTTIESVTQEPTKEPNLFAPDLHSTIQEAINRIVKISKASMNETHGQEASVVRVGQPLRSSLSLNVLLKNFGVHNLANLDQILLKSTLRNDTNSERPTGVASQKIQINGIHHQSGQIDREGDEQQSAECKIEYTMRHVNISLLNGGNGDYTCDYIIDRKIAGGDQSNESSAGGAIDKVCKLQLTSRFFSNDQLNGTSDVDCNKLTYLAIGPLRFCFQVPKASLKSLNRTFDFPLEHDAFDIKMVHKQRSALEAEMEEGEIHLEIKPLTGKDCTQPDNKMKTDKQSPAQVSPVNMGSSSTPVVLPKSSTTTTTSTSTTTTPRPNDLTTNTSASLEPMQQVRHLKDMAANSSRLNKSEAELDQRGRTVTVFSGSPKNRFVLKVPAERQPHPLNQERFKVSQTFDVTSAPRFAGAASQLRPRDSHTGLELCDSFAHVATVGQLSSPGYPDSYAANTSCHFVIRQAISSYCQLLLHFRDFDLVTANDKQQDDEHRRQDDCSADYLQIGETRYCNKYAMIGHRMKLDFPRPPAEPLMVIRFVSDWARSGRGFLIKYQQLNCDPPTNEEDHSNAKRIPMSSTTQIGHLMSSQEQKAHTLAPPQEKPDFSLALKARASQSSADGTNNTHKSTELEPMRFNERTVVTAAAKRLPSNQTTPAGGQPLLMASTSIEPVSTTRSADWLADQPSEASRIECNEVHGDMSFLLSSPNAPLNYPNNAQCLYYLRRNSSSVCYVELTFIAFDLEADADCRFDYLEINGVRLCGSLRDMAPHKTTRIYLFEEPIKLIRFKSDSSATKAGFLIRVDQLECAPNGPILRQAKSLPDTSNDLNRIQQVSRSSSSSMNVSSSLSARTIEYDSLAPPKQQWPATDQPAQRFSSSDSSGSFLSGRPSTDHCDQVLHGREVTIKSPHWPDSYSNDESLAVCRYTIVRDTLSSWRASNSKKICQLELRFINLRLGTSDCIDVDGYEVLCGFNTRSMVKYYPFERQSYLTISFFTGAAKFVVGRSLGSQSNNSKVPIALRFMIVAKQHECVDGFLAPQPEDASAFNQTNNLLYVSQQPALRYANRTDLHSPPRASITTRRKSPDSLLRYDFSNSTPLLSIGQQQAANKSRQILVHSLGASNADTSLRSNQSNSSSCPDGSIVKQTDQLLSAHYPAPYLEDAHCVMVLERASERACQIELEFLDLDLHGSNGNQCGTDFVQVNHGDRYCNMQQVMERLGAKQRLLVPFTADGRAVLSFHTSSSQKTRRGFLILHRQLDCASRSLTRPNLMPQPIQRLPLGANMATDSGEQSKPSSWMSTGDELDKRDCSMQFTQFNGIISSSSILAKLKSSSTSQRNECKILVKLLPGYCGLQVNFNEFELSGRNLGYCLLDFLELNNDGVQYCSDDLKGANRTLSALPSTKDDSTQRLINMRYSVTNSSNSYGFRAVFKQIECQSEPLRPISNLLLGSTPKTASDRHLSSVADQPDSNSSNQETANLGKQSTSQPASGVDFKEIRLQSEFFELNSAKLSKSMQGYDPNMFIVYRVKRWHPEVCKIRLMFYQFDLEPSTGCKRDFLDVNNVDRLCGRLGKPEDFRRDYDWPANDGRDFLISFVSDSSRQQDGFLLFGQQIRSNCSASISSAVNQQQVGALAPTFDEESPKQADLSVELPHTAHRAPGTSMSKVSMTKQNDNQKPAIPTTTSTSSDSSNCYKLHYEPKFEISSPNWPQKYLPKTTCYHLIHKADSDTCSVSFNVVSMILGPEELGTCSLDNVDYLEIDGQLLCGLMTRPQVINVQFEKRQFITAKFVSHQANGFGFFIEAKQNKCSTESAEQEPTQISKTNGPPSAPPGSTTTLGPTIHSPDSPQGQAASDNCNQLQLEETNYIESENFPKQHKHNQDCLYVVRRQNLTVCAIDIVMNYFDLDASGPIGSCESDYLEIDYSRFCGSYPANHKLRFNYFGEELDKVIKFHSDSSIARTGFSLTIKQVSSSECTSSNGSDLVINSPSPESQSGATQEEGNKQSQTPATNDEVINYLPDSTGPLTFKALNSSSSSIPSVQTQMMSRPENGEEARQVGSEFGTLCQFVYHKEKQLLLSPSYSEHKRLYQNNVECLYKIVAKSYDFCSLKLTILDLDLEQSSDCHNDYLLIDNKRYCGNSTTQQMTDKIIEVQFADTLPREIHLLYHTNGHLNEGRGFKLSYEQQACSQQDDQSFGLQNGDLRIKIPSSSSDNDAQRQTRRLRFGQVSYPKNYVSQQPHPSASWKQPPEPQPANHLARSAARQSATTRQQGEQRSLDLDGQHDDLTLRKEIAVVKSGPVVLGPRKHQSV